MVRYYLQCLLVLSSIALTSCAVLHHVQVGEINDDSKFALRPFELKVSETGVDFKEAGKVAQALTRSKQARSDVDSSVAILQLFQQGPRTGVPVFTETYAQNIVNDLYKECPSGRITGVVSIREMRKYPVISGEIVKIRGYCMLPRDTAVKVDQIDRKANKTGKAKESI